MEQTSKGSITAFFSADNVNTLPSIQVEDPSDGSKYVPRMKKIFQHTQDSKIKRNRKKNNNDNEYSIANLSSLLDMSGSLTYSPSRSRGRGGLRSRRDGKRRGGLTGLTVGLGFKIPTTLMVDHKVSKNTFARIDPSNETKKRVYVDDPILAELRTYLNSMDEYKATSFTIWGGKTLRSTPEFTSYRENHVADWGSISTIINSLEKIMQKYDVPLAIINGDTVAALAGLALPRIDKEQLLNCCSNRDTVEAAFTSMRNANDHNQQFRAAILLQSLLRRWKAMRYFREEKERRDAAMAIQLRYRYHYYRNKLIHQRAERDRKIQLQIEESIIKLRNSWGTKNHPSFLVIIPCITVPDFIQKGTKYFHELHGLFTLFASQLSRPNCEMCFVIPDHLNEHEMQRLDMFLMTLVDPSDRHAGIDNIRKRLHFVVPELGMILPKAAQAASQMTLSDLLWYSPGALRRIKRLCSRHPGSVILPAGGIANLTHEKLASYLNISLLAPNPHLSLKLASRSTHKKIFEQANISFPPGAHSINTQDDLIKALSRLIVANMSVRRWNIRLNTDIDNETLLWFEPLKLNIYDVIKNEMIKILKLNDNNVGAWYSRPVQLSARKRLSTELIEKIEEIIHIDRKDIFVSWVSFLRKMKKFGCVIEADAEHFKLGNISNSFFISPNGDLIIEEGLDKITDSTFESTQAYLYPSVLASSNTLKKVTKSIANTLFYNYQAVGYFNVTFVSYFDVWEHCPRLWALDLHVGLSCASGALGCLQVISSHTPKLGAADDVVVNIKHKNMEHVIDENEYNDNNENNHDNNNDNNKDYNNNNIVPQFPGPLDIVIPDPPQLHVLEDRLYPQKYVLNPEMHFHGARSMLYIPIIFHSPLKEEDEDMFYRLIAKRGLVFNMTMRVGVLIMHICPLERGMIGLLCIHETRIRTLELATQALISIYELIGGEEKIIEEIDDNYDDNNSIHSNKSNKSHKSGGNNIKNKQQSIHTIGTNTNTTTTTTTINNTNTSDTIGNKNFNGIDKKLRCFEGIRLVRILGNLKTIMRHDISVKHSEMKNQENVEKKEEML